jgi:peptide-methionine (S)-S-oxide reductase
VTVRKLGLAAVGLLAVAGLWLGGRGLAARGAGADGGADAAGDTVRLVETTRVTPETDGVPGDAGQRPETTVATFAGGCFWCMEPPFDRLEGVEATTSGYAGGEMDDPSYEQVSSGSTEHLESVQVTYDPSVVSYTRLLEVFWHNVDPTDDGGQFCDRGHQYTTAVFAHNREQRRLAEASKRRLAASGALGEEIVTDVVDAGDFWPAEDYHQDFYRKNPGRYESYRTGCGRDRVLRSLWGEAAGH